MNDSASSDTLRHWTSSVHFSTFRDEEKQNHAIPDPFSTSRPAQTVCSTQSEFQGTRGERGAIRDTFLEVPLACK